MRHLNYKHLHYFWVIASEGGVVRAAERLFLTPQTLSSQLAQLEDAVGSKLFRRAGRRLHLTETGELVFRYADEMFRLGAELNDVLRGRLPGGLRPLRVAIVDVLPKRIAYRILEPAFALDPPVRLTCIEGKLDDLLIELSRHHVDLVLSDSPAGSTAGLRVYNHALGASGVTFFSPARTASRYQQRFPASLSGAPMVLPTHNTALRRSLELWFDRKGINPDVRAEVEDSALLKAFGAAGVGMFPAASVIEAEIVEQYDVRIVGRTTDVIERFVAISAERRIKHPAVAAISDQARSRLFTQPL
ncbi:MAG: transcriptional activator NhaR [Gammaproteobacteria bacterium]|nr:transcriptional activator NhaR [Gammaproteobacteria bacterium]